MILLCEQHNIELKVEWSPTMNQNVYLTMLKEDELHAVCVNLETIFFHGLVHSLVQVFIPLNVSIVYCLLL